MLWSSTDGPLTHSGAPRLAQSAPPFPALSEQSPALPPADEPPVPYNQVSLLLCAHSAELNQLPLMACGPPPLLARGGGGEAETPAGSGKGPPHSLLSDLSLATRTTSKPLLSLAPRTRCNEALLISSASTAPVRSFQESQEALCHLPIFAHGGPFVASHLLRKLLCTLQNPALICSPGLPPPRTPASSLLPLSTPLV